MAVQPVPEGFHTVTPYLVVSDAAGLIEFMKTGLGARELFVARGPDGTIGHAVMQIGDSRVMLGQASGAVAREFPAMLYVYVPDCDALYAQALRAGATSVHELATQFYGDRHGAVQDRWGNQWWIATHVEDVPPEELDRRMKAARSATA